MAHLTENVRGSTGWFTDGGYLKPKLGKSNGLVEASWCCGTLVVIVDVLKYVARD